MATRKPAAESKSTAVVPWQEEMAKAAAAAAAMEESTATGSFFGTKGGILTWQDARLPGNRMAVVILDHVLENVYFTGEYDPDTPQAPVCFAFGRDEAELAPHEAVSTTEGFSQQCESCKGCEFNKFGSAEKGRGKACRNTRRLAMISAGTIDKAGAFEPFDDEEKLKKATIGYMKLPVTSVKGFAGFVKSVSATLGRPPFGVYAEVRLEPDEKNQFTVIVEALGEVPDELMPVVLERHREAAASIIFPYTPIDESAEPAAKTAPKRGAKAAQPGRRKY